MSSRTSVYWWSTFTRLRLRSHARRCSQTKWRPVVSKTKFVALTSIYLHFFYDASSVGCPWTSCCPCRWETTGHPRRWARGVQGVDSLYLLREHFCRYMISHVAYTRHFQNCKGKKEFKVCFFNMSIPSTFFFAWVRSSIKQLGIGWAWRLNPSDLMVEMRLKRYSTVFSSRKSQTVIDGVELFWGRSRSQDSWRD